MKLSRFLIISLIITFALALSTAAWVYFKISSDTVNKIAEPVEAPEEKEEVAEKDYSLSIDKIGISVPIILNVDGNDKESYNKALEGGVAHLLGSAFPGKPGNTFIFGHSSYYAWKPGGYKEVFATLDQLSEGDAIIITSSLNRYEYKVASSDIVSATDVAVANQNLAEKKLTLMTCWPVGSDAKRLVVVALLESSKTQNN